MPESVWLIVRGAVAIAIGLIAFTWPGITLAVLISVFAIYALVGGVASLFVGLCGRVRVWANVLQGVLGIGAAILTFIGVMIFAFPGADAVGVAWLLGAYALAAGITFVALGIRLHAQNIWFSRPVHM